MVLVVGQSGRGMGRVFSQTALLPEHFTQKILQSIFKIWFYRVSVAKCFGRQFWENQLVLWKNKKKIRFGIGVWENIADSHVRIFEHFRARFPEPQISRNLLWLMKKFQIYFTICIGKKKNNKNFKKNLANQNSRGSQTKFVKNSQKKSE